MKTSTIALVGAVLLTACSASSDPGVSSPAPTAQAAPRQAPPGPGTAPFAAACRQAALNMQSRVRADTPDHPALGRRASFWDAELARLEPDARRREALIQGVQRELQAALRRTDYLTGMVTVSEQLTWCLPSEGTATR